MYGKQFMLASLICTSLLITSCDDGDDPEFPDPETPEFVLVEQPTNGTVTATTISKFGDEVTITVTPDDGYALDKLMVGDKDVTKEVKDGKYTIPYVIEDVKVTATFKAVSAAGGEEEPKEPAPVVKKMIISDDVEGGQKIGGWGNSSTIEIIDENGSKTYKFTNPSEVNSWEAQTAYDIETPFENGIEYIVEFDIKASADYAYNIGFQNTDGYKDCGNTTINLTTDWQHVKTTIKCTGDGATRFIMSYGSLAGSIYLDNVELYIEEAGAADPQPNPGVSDASKEFLVNDDVEGGQKIGGWGNGSTIEIVEDNGSKVYKLTNPSEVNSWEAQTAYDIDTEFVNGTTYHVEFDVKADSEYQYNIGFQNTDGYKDCGNTTIKLTTEWQHINTTINCTGDGAKRFIMSYGTLVGSMYLDNFQVYTVKE